MTVTDFFRKYHAVPATDKGPDWPHAKTDAIEGQLNGMLQAASVDDPVQREQAMAGLRTQMIAAAKELMRRKDCTIPYADLQGVVAICERVAKGA